MDSPPAFDIPLPTPTPRPAMMPPPPPPLLPTATPPLVTESDADFFRRFAAEMRAYDPKESDPPELQKRRLYAALGHAYLSYVLFLKARRWPLEGSVLGLDLDLTTKTHDDLARLYARLIGYAEHGGMYVEDKHFLSLQRFGELCQPPPAKDPEE